MNGYTDGNADKDRGTGMKTDTLIGLLAQDARLRSTFANTLLKAFAIAVVVASLVFLVLLKPRPDLAAVAGSARVLFKFALTLPLAVAALGLVDRLGRPAAPTGPWPWLIAGVALLLASGLCVELFVVPSDEWAARLVGRNSRYCLLFIPLIALGPLACLIAALRRGAPSHPGRSGAAAGLAATGIAASLYALHCPDDSPLFVATWYLIATSVVVLAGYAAGRLFIRG